jgi:hypothetical protein
MTLNEQAVFTTLLTRLAATLNEPLAEDRVEGYLEALADMDVRWLQIAAGAFGRTATFLPKPHEWRSRANQAEREAASFTRPQQRAEPWHAECSACQDTGWVPHHCPEDVCGRPACLYPHGFVSRCPCRVTNRTYQRHHGKGAG